MTKHDFCRLLREIEGDARELRERVEREGLEAVSRARPVASSLAEGCRDVVALDDEAREIEVKSLLECVNATGGMS